MTRYLPLRDLSRGFTAREACSERLDELETRIRLLRELHGRLTTRGLSSFDWGTFGSLTYACERVDEALKHFNIPYQE